MKKIPDFLRDRDLTFDRKTVCHFWLLFIRFWHHAGSGNMEQIQPDLSAIFLMAREITRRPGCLEPRIQVAA